MRPTARLGMSQIIWTEDDLQRVERIGRAAAPALIDALPGDQRRAVQARVLEELEYGEIARRPGTSEQVLRKRVSRAGHHATTADRRISMSGFDHLEQELRAAQQRRRAAGHARLRPLPVVPLLALVATAAIFVGARQATITTLATLARSQRTVDRLPPRIIGPPNRHVYPYGTYPPMTGIYVRYIRKARHRFGANYYLVPAANANTLSPVPERCYAEQRNALRRELPTILANLRQAALTLQSRYIANQQAALLPYPGVCLTAINDTGNGDGCSSGYSLSQIKAGHTLTSGAPAGVPVVYGLAPTGVRTVTLYYPRRAPQTVLAINNVFILHTPRQKLPRNGLPDRLVWRGTAGQLIKTITLR